MRKREKDRLVKFASSPRGQFVIGRSLYMASKHLKKLEERKIQFPRNGELAAPADRKDMEYLLPLFPLYQASIEAMEELDKNKDFFITAHDPGDEND